MEERRSKGLCYNCDEKNAPGHRYKRLFLLEGIEKDEPYDKDPHEEMEAEDAGAYIHALSNPGGAKTMQIWGEILGHNLRVLIDSGSTHCFVDTLTANKLGLTIATRPPLHVSVANGGQLRCSGVSRNVQIVLGSANFTVDLFLIPLGEFGVVLGVNWLCTLGTINWDFSNSHDFPI